MARVAERPLADPGRPADVSDREKFGNLPPPIVFIHGQWMPPGVWSEFRRQLGVRGYLVLALLWPRMHGRIRGPETSTHYGIFKPLWISFSGSTSLMGMSWWNPRITC